MKTFTWAVACGAVLLLGSIEARAQFVPGQGSGGFGGGGGGGGFGGGFGQAGSGGGGLSPYLNLARRNNNSQAINYYGLVRPQQNLNQALQGLQNQAAPNQYLGNDQDQDNFTPTGHMATFLNYGGFFPMGGRGGRGGMGGGGMGRGGMGGGGMGSGGMGAGGANSFGAANAGRGGRGR